MGGGGAHILALVLYRGYFEEKNAYIYAITKTAKGVNLLIYICLEKN